MGVAEKRQTSTAQNVLAAVFIGISGTHSVGASRSEGAPALGGVVSEAVHGLTECLPQRQVHAVERLLQEDWRRMGQQSSSLLLGQLACRRSVPACEAALMQHHCQQQVLADMCLS